ncbi:hypothetical protein QQS21_008396 [Conoideocrella luteorostrata]|uniref:CPAF-like PDZ domain-containing protein n=1 Tax=Conoideocrella luteorostrata TaxID=1105319 RepID=A0AAJ0FR78_9HYPO|nr:hypothetical protein QQS21_008396 [Conoideocrella luteorostrata]
MKTNSIVAAALLASAADIAAAAPQNGCNADNCLRALRATQIPGRLESAKAFCATYTIATGTVAPTAIPTYASDNCKDNLNGVMSLRISSACSCIAPATKTTTQTVTQTTTPTGTATAHPCAEISASWAAQKKAAPTAVPTVAAALAHKCLKTVPLGKDEGIKLVDAIEPYLEWQSDAAYKKDPPKDYFYPGFDIFGNLAKVKSGLQSGKYDGEYDFQVDLYRQVWAPGQDGHYVVYPDLLSRAFKWRRQPLPIVSVSEDGTSLPVIKLQKDVAANPKAAQAITKINGIDAAKYVEDTVNSASFLQDVDASYNTMFWSKSTAANGGVGNFVAGGRSSLFYHGPTTALTFANGTTVELENLATIVGDMTNVVDGPSMYKKFCTPIPMKAAVAAEPPAGSGALPGYPAPVIATKDGTVTGYYLSGEGLNDVAVIALKSFEPASPAEFQAVTSDFLREAKAAGKTKLIVDFQNNGGGYILLGYDFFRQLFPKVVQDGNSRWKESKSFAGMSRAVSDLAKNINPATEANPDLVDLYQTWFNYRYDLNLTDENFATYEDKFAPHVYKDTEYTNLMRWNLSDPLTTVNQTFGIGVDVSGYRSRANLPQYFKAEDIIMLYDGACSSTCTLASEFLRLGGGVKSVSLGGRPKKGPIQAVGGIKGSQVLQFSNIYSYAKYIGSLTNDAKIKAELARFTTLPMERSTASAVNVRDQILKDNVNDGVPAQYVYEAADCRLYWTAPMISDVTEVWKATANSAFNGAKCVAGGIKGSKPGRRSEAAAPVFEGRRSARLSESVDTTFVEHSEKWEAQHLQMAIQ